MTAPFLPVTALYASLAAVLIVFLAYRVAMFRKSRRIGMGDGEDKEIGVAIRAHANAVEYAPISLILLALAELNGLSGVTVHALGALMVASRVAHAWGFTQARGGPHPGRLWGIVGSWLAIVVLAAVNIITFLRAGLA